MTAPRVQEYVSSYRPTVKNYHYDGDGGWDVWPEQSTLMALEGSALGRNTWSGSCRSMKWLAGCRDARVKYLKPSVLVSDSCIFRNQVIVMKKKAMVVTIPINVILVSSVLLCSHAQVTEARFEHEKSFLKTKTFGNNQNKLKVFVFSWFLVSF